MLQYNKKYLKKLNLFFSVRLFFLLMTLDQRSIAIFLHLQGKNKKAIHAEMLIVLKGECVGYSSISRFIREFQVFNIIKPCKKEEKVNVLDEIDFLIKDVVDEEPFLSVRQIAKRTGIPKSTVFDRMTSKLGYISKHLKWIPCLLSDEQKQNRVIISIDLLKVIQKQERQGWKYFVTGDESWFYLSYDYERQWVVSGEEPDFRVKKMISSEKLMISVFWNPNGIVLVDALPKGQKFNSEYYINNILKKLHESGGGFPDTNGKKLNVHADNARPHTSKMTIRYFETHGMKKVPHPAFSPDLAPSDFFLFGYVKLKLEGQSFTSRDELFSEVTQILNEIQPDVLKSAFLNWKERLQTIINNGGEYI